MRRAALFAAALAAGPAVAEIAVNSTRYTCERGVGIAVSYVTAAEGSAAVLQIEGRQIALLNTEADSGMRYAWPSDGSGYVLWSKGSEATLSWFDAEKSAEVVLYAACVAE